VPPKPGIVAAAAGEKRQFLVHIDAEVVRRIKILAIDRNVSASSLVQQALLDYLAGDPAVTPGPRRRRARP
jgi:hypothetical protein